MQIKVQSERHHIHISIPSCLLFNALSAVFIRRFAISHIDSISGLTYEQLRILLRALKHSRKKLHGTPLIDIESSNGDNVHIFL